MVQGFFIQNFVFSNSPLNKLTYFRTMKFFTFLIAPMKKLSIFFFILWMNLMCVLATHGQTFRIFDKPIIFDEERTQLSVDYLNNRHGIETSSATIEPDMVVVHWTAVPTLEATFDIFNPVHLAGRPELTSASRLNVSAHFLVDRDGVIFRLLPDKAFGRHTIGLNYMAIGIENIGGPDAPLTRAQLKANEELIRYLHKKHQINYVIGHHEYYAFQQSSLWKETDPDYITQKQDPGDKFMKRLRKRLRDLDFKNKPE
jgi:N-acetylmuramoyl-L-alanine amidase